MTKISKSFSSNWHDYELIDAGGGRKLERFGSVTIIRPEVQAYFRSGLLFDEWDKIADWQFIPGKGQSGKWKQLNPKAPRKWTLKYESFTFQLELTKFKHIGIFPEQRLNWDLIRSHVNEKSSCLNLFAYTGAMSCVSKGQGADTLHVDSVKQLISWAAINMELSNLINIKWVHEDALKFINRLVKRDSKFDAIIMDPPAWGIGAKNEKWKLEDKLEELIFASKKILSDKGILVLNTYSPKVNSSMIQRLAEKHFSKREFIVDELWMNTNTNKELYFGIRLIIGA